MLGSIAFIGKSKYLPFIKMQVKNNLRTGVQAFENHEEALDGLLKRKFPLVILHKKSSEEDEKAYQTIKSIRDSQCNKETPIVVTHSGMEKKIEEEYLKSGASGCINMTENGPGKFILELIKYI